MDEGDGSETIKISDLKKFITDCFYSIGVNKPYSELMSESLVGADLIGHTSHGVFRLDKFISDAQNGSVNVHAEPTIIKETPATAWVDGNNSLGAVVGTYCMKLAIAKAKEVGAAIVCANNSNNFGVASFYNMQALKEGLLGFSFTNSSPLMLQTRSKDPTSGTNPISFGAPGLFGDYFLLDMATTVTSGGNIEIKYDEGQFLPVGWAVNAACLPETNADVALKSGRFLPLGSQEELGSYKGSGLSMMVDVLCGVLSGAHYCKMVGVWVGRAREQHANVGHCFMVIDPKRFAPDFEVRLTELMSYLRGMTTDNPKKPVKVPGDRARQIMKDISESGGIKYPKYVVDIIKQMATDLKLKCVPFIAKEKKVQMSPSEELSIRLEVDEQFSQEVSTPMTEEDIAEPDDLLVNKDEISIVSEDSPERLLPVTESTYEGDRATSLLKENVSKNAENSSTQDTENSRKKAVTNGSLGQEEKSQEEIIIVTDADPNIMNVSYEIKGMKDE